MHLNYYYTISFFWIWGSIVYYYILKEKCVKSKKFVPKGKKGYLIEYNIESGSMKAVKI